MLAREAAIEFAPDKITVNVIAPAGVKLDEAKTGDPRWLTSKPDAAGKAQFGRYPLGREGLPSDVAHLACFLASPEACFITGTTIRLDGAAMLL